jgi:hypothetical protein
LRVGQRFSSGEYLNDRRAHEGVRAEFDPQPFHLDEAAGESTVFQGLVSSGWHTAAISMRLMVGGLPIANGIIGYGGEIEWPKPTRPGHPEERRRDRRDTAFPLETKSGRCIGQHRCDESARRCIADTYGEAPGV